MPEAQGVKISPREIGVTLAAIAVIVSYQIYKAFRNEKPETEEERVARLEKAHRAYTDEVDL